MDTIRNKIVVAYSGSNPGIFLEGQRKSMKVRKTLLLNASEIVPLDKLFQ
jgi:hypothetical protein